MPQIIAGFDYQRLMEYLRRTLEVAQDTGVVTRPEPVGSTALQDTNKSWKEDMWADYFVEIVEGAGMGQIRRIVSNTANTITVDAPWTSPLDTTSRYAIRWAMVAKQAIVSPLTPQGNLRAGIVEDQVNLAKSSDIVDMKNTLHTDITSTQPRDITSRPDRVLGQLTDGVNTVSPKIFGITNMENVSASLVDADETVEQSIVLDMMGRTTLSVFAKATAATTFTLEGSDTDNFAVILFSKSWSGVTSADDTLITGIRYWRLRSSPAGSPGDKVTLKLSGGR
jgi:hypothetical protein